MVDGSMQEHIVDCRGLNLHVIDRGRASRRVVLLHHGFLDQARSWDPVAEALSDEYRVLAVDARGHGDSGWVGRGGYYYFQDYVSDLFDVAGTLARHRRLILVGHSMGGMVCSLFAGTFPDRVQALVSVEGAGPPSLPPSAAPELTLEWIQGVRKARRNRAVRMKSPADAARRLRAYNPRLSREFSLHLARHGTRRSQGGDGYVWKFDPLHRTRTPQPFYLDQARAFWSRIASPTLIVRGGASPFQWDPSEHRECIPRACTVMVPSAGHMVHHDQPIALARVIREFLREVIRPSARGRKTGSRI